MQIDHPRSRRYTEKEQQVGPSWVGILVVFPQCDATGPSNMLLGDSSSRNSSLTNRDSPMHFLVAVFVVVVVAAYATRPQRSTI